MKDAADLMQEAMETFRERGKVYGKNYYQFGDVMCAIFPDGLEAKTVQDWRRLGVLVQIVGKLTRYSNNFSKGGHQDSIHDTGVYSFMLEELDLIIDEEDK